MGFKKGLDGVRITSKAVGALAVARTTATAEKLVQQAHEAKVMARQDLNIKRVVNEQERREGKVIEAALAVEKIDARIASLQEKRLFAVAQLEAARALMEDVESLTEVVS